MIGDFREAFDKAPSIAQPLPPRTMVVAARANSARGHKTLLRTARFLGRRLLDNTSRPARMKFAPRANPSVTMDSHTRLLPALKDSGFPSRSRERTLGLH